MSKHSVHLGARRRFLCRHRPGRVRRASPATRSCRSTARRSPRPRSNTGCRWLGFDRLERRTTAAKPVVPDPPDYTACIAHLEATAAKPAKGSGQADQDSAEERVRTAVQIAAAGGARLPDLLVLGARRSRIAGREGERRGSQERVRKDQERAVPQARRIQEIPRQLRSDASRICCCASSSTCCPRKSSRRSPKKKRPSPRRRSRKYYKEHKSQFGTPEKRDVRIDPDQDRSRRPRKPRRKSNRARASRRWPRANRSTRRARTTAAN